MPRALRIECSGAIYHVMNRDDGSTRNCYHADGNGNITYLVNSSQTVAASYRYDPYGNTISSSGTLVSANVYRFSSKELHVNSGLYYYGYRWYHPNLQRWLNRDPLSELGFETSRLQAARADYTNPAEVQNGPNLYSFLQNDVLSQYDPYGLRPKGQDLDACLAKCDKDRLNEVIQNTKKLITKWVPVHLVLLGGTAISGCLRSMPALTVFLVADVIDAGLTMNGIENIKKKAVQNWIACCGGCAETPEEMEEVIRHIEQTPK